VSDTTPPVEGPRYTLGQLITELEGSERAYQQNSRTADRIEAEQGSIAAYAFRIQAAALLSQPNPEQIPGLDRIEALCDEWGTGLKAENVRKLRGRLCSTLGIGSTEANAMTLEAVADVLAPRVQKPQGGSLRSDSPAAPAGTPQLPRDLVQNYLLGKVKLTPDQERQYLGFDPDDVVEERHPEAVELEKWARIAVVQGKFRAGWVELPEACRWWRIPVEGEPNHWLPVIANCMQELFGKHLLEDELLGHLFRRHHMPPAQAAALSLADLAGLLRRECDCRTGGSPPAPHTSQTMPPTDPSDKLQALVEKSKAST
jgi:hypothetical protein